MRTYLRGYIRHRRNPWVEAVETVGLAVIVSYFLRILAFQAFYIPSRSMEETLKPLDHIISEKITYVWRAPRCGEIVVFDFGTSGREALAIGGASELHGASSISAAGSGRPAGADGTAVSDREYVKRVIGAGGDEIALREGVFYRNGEKLVEVYASGDRVGLDEARGDFALRIRGRRIVFQGGDVLVDGLPLDRALPASVPASSVEDRSPRNFVRLEGGSIGILKVRVPEDHLYLLGDNRAESLDSRFFGFVPVSQVRGRALLTYWPPRRFRVL